MDSAELAWVAGLLEGEATFAKEVSKRGYACISVIVSSVDEDVLLRLQRFVPAGVIRGPLEHSPNSIGKQPFWTWRLRRRDAVVNLLERIRPRMGERRRQQIDALLEMHALYPPQMGRGTC